MDRKVDFATVTTYVEIRRKTTGGYGATPRLPATIEDTFEAVAIAEALTGLSPETTLPHPPGMDDALHHYLRETARQRWPGLRTTWQLLHTCKRLALEVDDTRAMEFVGRHRKSDNDLATIYYTGLIVAELGLPLTQDLVPVTAAFPARLTVAEARMFLQVKKLAGSNPAAAHGELIPWLQHCQNGDGGFGFFPTTTSYIENCHHALAALRLLDAKPSSPQAAHRFITSCQTGTGGFGRNLRSAPFLDATWHALAAMRLLC